MFRSYFFGTFGCTAAAVKKALGEFHRDEVGAEEGMNKLLIFAMVALPLLALLIFFGKNIVEFATSQWEAVFGGGSNAVPIQQ